MDSLSEGKFDDTRPRDALRVRFHRVASEVRETGAKNATIGETHLQSMVHSFDESHQRFVAIPCEPVENNGQAFLDPRQFHVRDRLRFAAERPLRELWKWRLPDLQGFSLGGNQDARESIGERPCAGIFRV